MKILFVSSGHKGSGVPPIIKSQGDSLFALGVDLEYFTIDGKGISGYLKGFFDLRKKLKEKKFELIHVHYGISGLVVVLCRPKVPKILSLMGDDILGVKKPNGSISLKGKLLTLIIKSSLRYFENIIVKSKEMTGKIKNYNPYVLPNGVSFKNFQPLDMIESRNELKLDLNKTILLFPSNKNRIEKNYLLFKNAVEKIKDFDIEVISFNNTPHERTKYYFNSSNVVVLTSLHEGSPNVIKEAMACNIPIVSTNVGDVKDVIGQTEGCYIATFEPEDVSQKIKMAIDFGKRTNGREHIKHLEEKVIANSIVKLYNKTIGK